MIFLSVMQPHGSDLISQVEEIFSPTEILSRANNFEFRPQQQEIAMVVAQKKKAVVSMDRINWHGQFTEKDLPMLKGVFGSLAGHAHMVCVESGNGKQSKIILAPGKTAGLQAVLSSASMRFERKPVFE